MFIVNHHKNIKSCTISQQVSKTNDKKYLSLCDLDFLKSRKKLLDYLWKVRHQPWNYQSHRFLSKVTGLSVTTIQNCLREFRGIILDWRYFHRHSNWYTLLPGFYELPLFADRIKKFLSLTLLLSIINENTVQSEFYRPLIYRNLYSYDITSNLRAVSRPEIAHGENYELLKQEKVHLATDIPPNVFKKRARKEKRMVPTLDKDVIAQQNAALEQVKKYLPLTTHGSLLFFAFHPTVISLLGPIALKAKTIFKTQDEIMKWVIQAAKNISKERRIPFSFATYHKLREVLQIDKKDKNLIDMASNTTLKKYSDYKHQAPSHNETFEETKTKLVAAATELNNIYLNIMAKGWRLDPPVA